MAEGAVTNETLEYDRSVIGVEVEVGQFTVTREQIETFVEVMGETNPVYTDDEAAKANGYRGIIAPPTFFTVFRTQGGLDPKVKFGNTGFHAGQEFEFVEPLYVGDKIIAKAVVKDVYAKTGRTGTMVFTVSETAYYNQDGRKVARIENSMVRRFVERA